MTLGADALVSALHEAATVRTGSKSAEYTAAKKQAFLAAMALRGTVEGAAKAAHVDRSTVYSWRESDPAFRKAELDAMDDVWDTVESAMLDQARKGQFLPQIAILKARRPALYRDNYNDAARVKHEYHVTFVIGEAKEAIESTYEVLDEPKSDE